MEYNADQDALSNIVASLSGLAGIMRLLQDKPACQPYRDDLEKMAVTVDGWWREVKANYDRRFPN